MSTVANDHLVYASRLRLLNILAFFVKTVTCREGSQTLQNLFIQSRNAFTHLHSLKLSGNRFTTFVVSEECLRKLVALDPCNNRFEYFSPALLKRLPSFGVIDISNNSLCCDC